MFGHVVFPSPPPITHRRNICAGRVTTQHLREADPPPHAGFSTPSHPSVLYLHGWNLEVGLLVQAVRHLEGRGAVHLPHAFQSDHVQLELGYQIEACGGGGGCRIMKISTSVLVAWRLISN